MPLLPPAERPVTLEPEPGERRAWLDAAARFTDALLDGLDAAPALGADAGTLAALDPTVREAPRSLDAALAWLGDAARLGLQTAGPGYLASVPGGGLYASALAAFVSLVMNRFTAVANASPGLARLEHAIVDWLARELGLPAGTAGYLPSGGSLANFTAIVTARVARFGDSGDFSRATIYTSTEAHRSVAKAARLAGIPLANVREVGVDQRLRIDLAALAAAIAADRAKGGEPVLIVANAGTTNVGAIDPLERLADLAAEQGLWLHVDAAYGGAFAITPAGRRLLAGLGRADSVALDPHKGFFLPYGTGCLLVRRGDLLRAAHAESAAYLQDLAAATDTRSAAEHGPELSRNDRGVLLWLPLWLHGAAAFRAALEEKLALAGRLREGLRALPVEVPLEPELSIVTFRLPRRPDEPLSVWNDRNRSFLGAINERQRVCLSSTLLPTGLGPAFTLRACVLSFRTHGDRIDAALDDIAAACREA